MSEKFRLTDPSVRDFIARFTAGNKKEDFGRDDLIPGFAVRVRRGRNGEISPMWYFQYWLGGTGNTKIGNVAAMPAGEARKVAAAYYAMVQSGRSPTREKRDARQRALETFGGLVTAYLKYKAAELRPGSLKEITRHLTKHCKPLHSRGVNDIDQRQAASLRTKIAETRGAATSNKMGDTASAFYGWLMREGIATSNPFANNNKVAVNPPRDRVLADAELAEIWRAAEDDQFGQILKLLMLFGARRNEVGNLAWREIDFDAALIKLPRERTKGNREHEIPLAPAALAILKATPHRLNSDGSERAQLFGEGKGGYQNWAKQKREIDRRILKARQAAVGDKAVPMPRWTLHDFRRSMSTTMHERFNILPHICEACLAHTAGSRIAQTYNRSRYLDQKREALAAWADHIMRAVEGGTNNVVMLRA